MTRGLYDRNPVALYNARFTPVAERSACRNKTCRQGNADNQGGDRSKRCRIRGCDAPQLPIEPASQGKGSKESEKQSDTNWPECPDTNKSDNVAWLSAHSPANSQFLHTLRD